MWHYQATRRVDDEGEIYEIREVYHLDGEVAPTLNAIAPESDSYEGLIWVLENMLKDARKYPVMNLED